MVKHMDERRARRSRYLRALFDLDSAHQCLVACDSEHNLTRHREAAATLLEVLLDDLTDKMAHGSVGTKP